MNELKLIMDNAGAFKAYDDTWDITIHCTSEEEHQRVVNRLIESSWVCVEEKLPSDDRYVLLSFSNFSLPAIGRYEEQEDGSGNWYLGDCDEGDTCLAEGLFVSAWMELPKRYEGRTL